MTMIHLAGVDVSCLQQTPDINIEKELKRAFVLQSFYYMTDNNYFAKNHSKCANFLLDSGIFSLVYGAKKVEINDKFFKNYCDKYADFIKTHNIQHYFELDLDALIGEKGVLKLRDRLEARAGRQSIPVWHINRRKEGFLRDLDHDYVAVGGLVNCRGKGRKVLKPLFPWLIDTAHEHGSAIHGLGYTVIPELDANVYRWDSVDSTSWVLGTIGGIIFTFKNGRLIKNVKPKDKHFTSTVQARNLSFVAWNAYAEYINKRYPTNYIK